MAKDVFIKIYSNLPEDVRKEIIVVVNEKPYTWNSAFLEIERDTQLGKNILKKLEDMELI